MKTLPVCIALLTIGLTFGQAPHEPVDFSTLYGRVSASDSVGIVALLKVEIIRPKLTADEAERLRQDQEAATRAPAGVVSTVSIPYDISKSAFLYTLEITRAICGRSDFGLSPREQSVIGTRISVLVPWRESGADGIGEMFAPGRSYLVFLEKDPGQNQFGSLYEVDTTRTYYRAHRRSRGVVPLSGETARPQERAATLLSAVGAVCEAVRPADYATKIANLRALIDAPHTDPGLRQSAQAAVNGLMAAQSRPQ